MKSYRLKDFGAALELQNDSTPEPQESQVLLRILAAGVCHSDLHIWEGGYDLGGGKKLLVKDRGVSLPLTMGHEIAGEVVAVGPQADTVRAGGRYLVYPWLGCGICSVCLDGDENLCNAPRSIGVFRDGGYSDYVLVPHERYLIPLDGLDPVAAAPLACSGLTTYSALRKAGMRIQLEPIVIFGAGGLGLMSLHLLKALGGVGAVVVDIAESKRAAAKAAGAIEAVDGRAPNALEQIVSAVGGPPRIAIDFVGSADTAGQAFKCLAKGGKLITVGLFGGAAPWSMPLIPLKAVTIQGSYVGNLDELKELVALVRSEQIPSIPITCAPLDSVNELLDRLHQGQVIGRAVLQP
jgi:D-arabinose 1-dehydrogenase-like Zn-dependent alcohol dehydrogenase